MPPSLEYLEDWRRVGSADAADRVYVREDGRAALVICGAHAAYIEDRRAGAIPADLKCRWRLQIGRSR